jgi:hypothetical protein
MYRVMSIEIVTYANKSQGMFEELVNNEFVPIKVLGWGTEWKGFTDKTKGVLKYLETKSDTDIVVFLDGFDTKVNKKTDELLNLFQKCECKVLVSKDPELMGGPMSRTIFGTCNGNNIANAGLYMGYTKELRAFLEDTLGPKCKDDQVNFNSSCAKHPGIKVDEDEKIFKNISPRDMNKESDAIFVSYPASPGFSRYTRAFVEYTQFVYIHVLCLLIVALAVFPRYKTPLVGITLGLTAFYALVADKSCTI